MGSNQTKARKLPKELSEAEMELIQLNSNMTRQEIKRWYEVKLKKVSLFYTNSTVKVSILAASPFRTRTRPRLRLSPTVFNGF